MKAILLFKLAEEIVLRSGETLALRMDCHQIDEPRKGFERAYAFSWIVFDPNNPSRRVLMDQHRNRPCHFHVGPKDVALDQVPNSIEEARDLFSAEVVKYFGEMEET